MTSLILAAAFFVGIHVVISGTTLRDRIVAQIGEGPFRGLFSLASLLGIVWMVFGYRAAHLVPLWAPLPGARGLALVLVLLGFLLAVVGVTTPSPTAVGGEERLTRDDAVVGILRVTRHPFLWGIALWAFAHLLANGDVASVLLFGTFLVLALHGPLLIDAKRRRARGAAYERFLAATSNVPFAAIAAGRTSLHAAELGWRRIAAGFLVYVAFLAAHRWLFGVSPLPGPA